jgi:hypothetical protein
MKALIRIPGNDVLTNEMPISIELKQGSIISPTVYGNATLPANC